MVSDAGMPAISDPGGYIINQTTKADLTVEVVPGPSAGIAALVGSGISPRRYLFEGFLPRKGSARANRLDEISKSSHTIVIYESPRRLGKTLNDLVKCLGKDRRVVIARELTKLHEEYLRGSLGELAQTFALQDPKGEIVIVLEGEVKKNSMNVDEVLSDLRAAKKEGLSTRDAVRQVATDSEISRRKVYELYLSSTRKQVR